MRGSVTFFALLALTATPASAENWVRVSAPVGLFYDAQSAFVDRGTGYVVFNTRTDMSNSGKFNHSTIAFDCANQRYFLLGAVLPNSRYEVVPGWQTDPSRVTPVRPNTVSTYISAAICPIRSSFKADTIK